MILMMKKKYHEALYDYIKTGGESLVIEIEGRIFRFRLPTPEDVVQSKDYSLFDVEKSSFLLAVSLQSVGGFSVSPNLKFGVMKYILNTPKITQRIINYYWIAVRESQEYSSYFEAFCYTQKSRDLWE